MNAAGNAAIPNAGYGIYISGASNNTIGGQGNVIAGNFLGGVVLTGAGTSGNSLQGNLIGTDVTGTVAIGNASDGVLISGGAASNTIGGTVAGSGNIISGNRLNGVEIINSGSNSNLVAANIIGADITGGLPLGNGGAGVVIANGASQNMIGGNTTTAANIISGNFGDGIDITSDSISDKVDANHIGVNAAGTQAVPNGGSGIVISGANHISLGGAEPGQGNVISANNGIGIFIFGAGTIDNTIQGNLVGTDENGTAALGNGSNGIDISDGASNNTVGGTADSKGNVISGNLSSGVFISDKGTSGNLVEGNLIGTNYLGTSALANQYQGVFIGGGATSNTIGGTASGSRNVISGNNADGVDLDDSGTSQNLVEGNLIGTDITGTVSVGNAGIGISISASASKDTIGGSTAAATNVISGNQGDGIDVTGLASSNVIEGNKIGVEADGIAAVANGGSGIVISGANHNTIGGTALGKRNLVSGNLGLGIFIYGSGTNDNLIEGNYVGTDISGIKPLGNGSNGVDVSDGASDNTVGGTGAGAGNLISGNDSSGVFISDSGTTGNLVEGNLIGTGITGTIALGNNYQGIFIGGGATANTVGGTHAGSKNIISGNNGDGIDFDDAGTSQNVVEGNFIGTDITGAVRLGNTSDGIAASADASDDTIGGTASGAGNVISGNGNYGVWISGSGVSGIVVEGNKIGTDVSGLNALGNSSDGIHIDSGAAGNSIGGTIAGAGNVIAFNAGNGVTVGVDILDAALDNAILENSIFSNNGLGIAVDNSAPQSAPVLSAATNIGSQTTITGTLSGAANTTFRVEFFSNPAGTSQGETYLGFVNATTDGSGAASFTFSPVLLVATSLNITGTATDRGGNTSEFSAPVAVQGSTTNVTSELSVKYGGFVFNRSTRDFTQTLTITNTSGAAITGPIELVLVALQNATLVNESGTTHGNPYITILSSGSLGIGQSLTITLVFADPTLATISYTPEFVAGPIPPDN